MMNSDQKEVDLKGTDLKRVNLKETELKETDIKETPRINTNIPRFRLILAGILLLIVLASFILFLVQLPLPCSSVQELNSSLTLKTGDRKMLGFNTDTDSLKFGVVSPAARVKRSVWVNYSRNAEVEVSFSSDFSSWVTIEPSRLSLQSPVAQEVFFLVEVPDDALPGEYQGRARFCFRE